MLRENYPRPNMIRPRFRSLDGEWQFEFGANQNLRSYFGRDLSGTIQVPYVPGCELSGVETNSKFCSLWYRKRFILSQFESVGSTLINFLAMDYRAEIYINGTLVSIHKGGYSSVHLDITALVHEGENELTVNILDSDADFLIPCGDQKKSDGSGLYPQMSGIWQSVWLEFAAKSYFAFVRPTAVLQDKAIYVQGNIAGETSGGFVELEVKLRGKVIGTYKYNALPALNLRAPVEAPELWSSMDGKLYELKLTLINARGGQCDLLHTYCAFRQMNLFENKLYVGGRPTFIRAAIDNSFFSKTYYTAPSAAAIKQDYLALVALGFNAVHFKQCYPSPKHLYLADKLGLIVKVELCSSGFDTTENSAVESFINENLMLVNRDFGYPSIAFWCLNREYSKNCEFQNLTFQKFKSADNTRFIVGSIGGKLYSTDLYEFLPKTGSENELKEYLYIRHNAKILTEKEEQKFYKANPGLLTRAQLKELPAYVGGYCAGELEPLDRATEKAFLASYERGYNLIAGSGAIGFSYEKLYDIGQEKCGLLTENRDFKLSREGIAAMRAINKRKAISEL